MNLKPFGLAFVAALLPISALAQTSAAPSTPSAQSGGWQSGSDIPLHPAFVTGTLPNGVRYAVRRNPVPEGRLSIRVHMRVGALMEEDDEQGWAHLLEHMLFRGSKDFPDGEGNRVWQRLGAQPGSHSNAFTSQSSTRYVLDISRADGPALDDALAILADMMDTANLDKDMLAKEQQIVLAERAMRSSEADARINKARSTFYQPGSRAGERNIIGTTETLTGAASKTLRQFYERWYRPERATIVIVGDAAPEAMAAAVRKAFGGWRGSGKAGVDPAPAPVPTEPPASLVVEPFYSDGVELVWQRPRPAGISTVARRSEELVDSVALMVLNQRLRREVETTVDIVRASVTDLKSNPYIPNRLSLAIQMEARSRVDDIEPAMARVYRVLNGALGGVRADEIGEEIRSLERAYALAVERETKAQSPDLADTLIAAIDPSWVHTDPVWAQALLTRVKPTITPEAVTARLRALFSARPRIQYLTGHEPKGGVAAINAMLDRAMGEKALADADSGPVSLDALVLPQATAKLLSQSRIDDLDITRAKLSNGIEIAMRPNDQFPNQITLRARVGRGIIARATNDPGLFWTVRGLGLSGIGPFDRNALQRLGAGRQILPQYMLETDGVTLAVTTTREDMADAMKLMVGAITQMRYDDTAVRRTQASFKTGYRNFLSDPSSMMELIGMPYRFGGDIRFRGIPTLPTVDRLTPESFRAFWSDELAKGPVRLTIVGDYDPATTLTSAAAMFGRLSPKATESPPPERTHLTARPANGKSRTTLSHIGDPDRAMAMLIYPTASSADDLKTARILQLTTYIVRQRLAEGFRAQQAGTYAAMATAYTNRALPRYGAMMISSELKPELIPAFEKAVSEIMADLAANGPDADSFARARTPLLAELETIRKGHAYWLQNLGDDLDDPKIIAAMRSYVSGRMAITPADVQAAARRYLVGADGSGWPVGNFVVQTLPAPKNAPVIPTLPVRSTPAPVPVPPPSPVPPEGPGKVPVVVE